MTEPGTPQHPAPDDGQDGLWDDGKEPGGEDDEAIAAEERDGTPVAARESGARRSGAWAQSLTSGSAVPGPGGLWIAEVPDRIIAFILDVIALAVVGVLIALIVGGVFGGITSGGATVGGSLESATGDLNVGAFLLVGVVALVVSFTYFTYSWVVLRSTPGMRLLGLRIGDQRDGRSISWDQALIRWLILGVAATLLTFVVYVPDIAALFLALLGLLWLLAMSISMVRSVTKQGWHDRYARTIVVRATRRAS